MSAGRHLAPALLGAGALLLWEVLVRWQELPVYILPGPLAIFRALVDNWAALQTALLVTLKITVLALGAAVLLGGGLAVLFTQAGWLERALFPYAVILQVTPIVAIAPLIIIWTGDNVVLALLICAWIVAFFPMLSNTTIGLRSADRNLVDLFTLYRASPWQRLRRLQLPASLPYFFAGLRVSGGLALIGAVVAEFVAGTGGTASGLAYVILEAGYRLQIAKMFAALALIAAAGIAIFVGLSALSRLALRRWHASAIDGEP
ncbi:MAG: ABC transporter permease [Alphaproteobacteria bacterium]|nr:ABC transporter permease [Alphaproteobacteria bacterium]